MTEPTAVDSSAAAALVAAAAASCPPDAPDWTAQVRARAFELLRLVADVVGRSAVLASCKVVTGVIVSVHEHSGRAVITTRPTMGDQDKEEFRTPWLSEPAGVAMAEHARSLVGRHARIAKTVEKTRDGKRNVNMAQWIEDLGPAESPAVSAPPAAVTRPVTAPVTPPREPVTAPADDDPFRPFDESDELLAGPLWARQFAVAMTASNWGPKTVAAVIRYATGGRTGDPRSVLRTEAAKVASTHRRLDAGELAEDSEGHLVDVRASHGPGAAA